MQKEVILRICECGKALPLDDKNQQRGWLCCDLYYCSEECLNKSFEGTGTTWLEHYDDDGECYYSEWELEELEPITMEGVTA